MKDSRDHKNPGVFRITGDWKDQSNKLKIKYLKLTDEDLKFEVGNENALFKRIQDRLHKTREEVIAIIKKGQPSVNL